MTFAEKWQEFLQRLFHLTKGRADIEIRTESVVAISGFDQATTTSVFEYLVGKGFIRGNQTDLVSLTISGLDKLQELKLI